MNFTYKNNNYYFSRYPYTTDQSLKAWGAADEYLLDYFTTLTGKKSRMAIYNDRFGFLSTLLKEYQPFTIINYKSQEKAIRQNMLNNSLEISQIELVTPLEKLPTEIDLGMIKIPKSLDLFRLQLQQLFPALTDNSQVVCAFMTRHFSKQILEIAQDYFESVEQSKAWKKSRLLVLQGKIKTAKPHPIINTVAVNDKKNLQQYFGVFSANNIDYATQFLIPHIKIKETENKILDLACGNGVLAWYIRGQSPSAKIYMLDDAFLAVESARLNIRSENTFFHFNDTLDDFNNAFFDLVVCNPPFHFEYETNIDVSLTLFRQVHRCLKNDGRFILVANKHLNYATHLRKLFTTRVVAENQKFIIYACEKN